MAFTTAKGRTQTSLSEINVTPFVDVMMVLLVIFMLTAPILESPREAGPQSEAAKEILGLIEQEPDYVLTATRNLATVTALKRDHGNTSGAALAAQMVKFKKVPTLSGSVSFSAKLHTVFGRAYRVIEVENNQAHFVKLQTASSPANIGR